MLHQLWRDEGGAVLSAEVILVSTILVIALAVGLSEVAVAVNTELNDISNAIGAIDQSYAITGFHADGGAGLKFKNVVAGSRFTDEKTHDDCDKNQSCDLVCGPPANDTCG